ncbi:MAG: serine hydrolase [Patescibacteria group bacterium]|jgi:beta-lactamase class A
MITLPYRKYSGLFALLLTFFLGVVFSLLFIQNDAITAESTFQEKHQSGYKYISPLLECDDSQEIGVIKYNSLRSRINDFIEEETAKSDVLNVSVYFRDLNNGPWIGINATEKFSPASLLKVPLLISYLKESETNPTLLKTLLPVTAAPTMIQQTIKPDRQLDPTKNYSIDELLYRMITYSDNDATASLFSYLPSGKIEQTYHELGLQMPTPTGHEDAVISVREYASFFRILYNSSYLNKQSSEQALDLLTRSVFKDGLIAGVKKGTVVAHKFGERQVGDENISQLHDCGIVYYPSMPYLICIMTRSDTKGILPEVISGISRIVYETISSNSK